MRKARTRLPTVTLSLLILVSSMTPLVTATSSESVTITVDPVHTHYLPEDNVSINMVSHNLDMGEKTYKAEWMIWDDEDPELSLAGSGKTNNLNYNYYLETIGGAVYGGWVLDTSYTLGFWLYEVESDDGGESDTYNILDDVYFSFTIGEPPEDNRNNSDGGDDEVERNHRDNLTGEASWDYLLKVEGDMMNVTYLYTQWVDEEFWSELDEDEDEETTTEEIRAYVDAQNSRLGDEGQDSPILYLGEQVIAWHDVSFGIGYSDEEESPRNIHVQWTMIAETTALGSNTVSFLIDYDNQDTLMAIEYGMISVELVSEDWNISSVSTPGAEEREIDFVKFDSALWRGTKEPGNGMPDVKVIMSPPTMTTIDEAEVVDVTPSCALSWAGAGSTDWNLITNELYGHYAIELNPGDYQLRFVCTSVLPVLNDMYVEDEYRAPSADSDVWDFSVIEGMEPLEFSIQWSTTQQGEHIDLTIENAARPVLILADGREIPGFTTVLATLGLLGAALIRRD